MKSILIVSGDFPYPPIHGGRLDVWNRIKLLKSMGFCIDLVYTGKNIEQDKQYFGNVKKFINDIYPVYRKNRIQDMLSFKPLQVESRKNLSNVVFKKNYDYIILEGDYVACILDNPTLEFTHTILRSHNEESAYLFLNRIGVIYTVLLLITISIIIYSKENKTEWTMEYEAYAVEFWMITLATANFGYIGRVAYYLGFFLCCYISKSIMIFNEISKKYFAYLLFIGFLTIFMYFVLSYRINGTDLNPLIPYGLNFSDL